MARLPESGPQGGVREAVETGVGGRDSKEPRHFGLARGDQGREPNRRGDLPHWTAMQTGHTRTGEGVCGRDRQTSTMARLSGEAGDNATR